MTNPTTMEQVRALSDGEQLTVNGLTWTVANGALTNGPYTVPLDTIRVEVEAGQVVQGIIPMVGVSYFDEAQDKYVYVIRSGRDESAPWVATFWGVPTEVTGNEVGALEEPITGRALTDLPEWLTDERRNVLSVSARMQRESDRHLRARRELESLLRTTREDHVAARSAMLTAFRDEFTSICEDEGFGPGEEVFDRLDALIVGQGGDRLPRPTEEIEVRVEVDGGTEVSYDSDELRRELPDGVEVEEYATLSGTVSWEWSGTITRTVDDGECGCEDLDRSDVEEAMQEEGISSDSYISWSASCPNC